MTDSARELIDLYEEWSECRQCELGQRRIAAEKNMVWGEGTPNAIMIIGEGPGRNEEDYGRPFIGKSGELLRQILTAYDLLRCCYITNITVCRACEVMVDDQNQPRIRKRRGQPDEIMLRDAVPTPLQIAACSPRLYREIYLVDPVVILAVGATAASFLLNRAVSITKERGTTGTCHIPGALWMPQLTEKKKVWARKVKGQDVLPVVQNQVSYTVIPTLHPAYVLRKEGDHGHDSPWNQLALDIKLAGEVYEKYMLEAHGKETLMNDTELEEDKVRHDGEEDEG